MAKEAYLYGKRGLFIWQKRPVYMAKEAYLYAFRAPRAYSASQRYECVNRALLPYTRPLLPYDRALLTLAHTSGMLVYKVLLLLGLFCHTNRALLTLTHTHTSGHHSLTIECVLLLQNVFSYYTCAYLRAPFPSCHAAGRRLSMFLPTPPSPCASSSPPSCRSSERLKVCMYIMQLYLFCLELCSYKMICWYYL